MPLLEELRILFVSSAFLVTLFRNFSSVSLDYSKKKKDDLNSSPFLSRKEKKKEKKFQHLVTYLRDFEINEVNYRTVTFLADLSPNR